MRTATTTAKRSKSLYAVRRRASLLALTTAFAVGLAAGPSHAIELPKGTDLALEWTPTAAAPTGGLYYLRVPEFRRWTALASVEQSVGAVDDAGQPAPWAVWSPPDAQGRQELWIEARAGRRYFLAWRRDAGNPRARERFEPVPAATMDIARPAGFEENWPVVPATDTFLHRAAAGGVSVASGGFLRVAKEDPDATFRFALRVYFHREPWRLRRSFEIAAGVPDLWLWLPALAAGSPVTVEFADVAGTGRVDFASGMGEQALLRTLPLGPTDLAVEARRSEFAAPSDLQTDAEAGQATLDAVRSMTFKGRAPEVFPIGWPEGHELDYEAGRRLGLNAVMWTPATARPELFRRLGFRYIYSYTHLLTDRSSGHGYRRDVNAAEMRKTAESWRELGLLDRVYRVSVFDEPGFSIAQKVQTESDRSDALFVIQRDPHAWSQMVQRAGLKVTDFADPGHPPPAGLDPASTSFWQHVRLRSAVERDRDPQGLLNSMLLMAAVYPTRFGNLREAIRDAFGRHVWVTANVHDSHWFEGALTDIEPWAMYSRLQALDVPQACDYNARFPQAEEFMVDLMRSALRPHPKLVDAMLASQAAYLTRSPRSLLLRAMSAVGAGARSLSFYRYGPRRWATENWYDTDREKLRTIGEIAHAVGWAETVLLNAKPPASPVAILVARDGDLWDALDVGPLYSAERFRVHHLLRGLHIHADFLNDAYLPSAAGLDAAKVMFLSQRCLAPTAAEALLGWVRRGGTLIGLLSCGELDHLARETPLMREAFGLAHLAIREADADSRARPSRRLGALGIEACGPTADVTVSSGRVVAAFDDGGAAIVESDLGAGRLRYVAFLAGHSYHLGTCLENDVLTGMQTSVRNLAATWMTPAGPPDCAADHPLVSARRLDAPVASAVVLVNSTGSNAVERVRITLARCKATTAESLEQGRLAVEREGDAASFSLPLKLTDVVLLR